MGAMGAAGTSRALDAGFVAGQRGSPDCRRGAARVDREPSLVYGVPTGALLFVPPWRSRSAGDRRRRALRRPPAARSRGGVWEGAGGTRAVRIQPPWTTPFEPTWSACASALRGLRSAPADAPRMYGSSPYPKPLTSTASGVR